MALFPNAPLPSSVSAPAVVDPELSFQTDQGYSLRRPRHSRPRFRYTVDWLGKRTDDMHIIRTFLLSTRLGALSFSWQHPTASEAVAVTNTTPVNLTYNSYHGLVVGQWVWVLQATPNTGLVGVWPIIAINNQQVLLGGTTAGGAGTAVVVHYMPYARAIFSEDVWASPTKLIGPESTGQGYFNWSLDIEELF